MGLLSFLGMMSLVDKSCDTFGTIPTLLGMKAISDSLEAEDNEDWYDTINNIWHDIQMNDEISDNDKNVLHDLCQRLVETTTERKRKNIISQIQLILKKYE